MAVRTVRLRYFAIVLVPVAVFLSHSVITDHMIPENLAVPTSILREDHDWLEAAGRYRFLAATWFFCGLAVLAAVLLLRTLARPTAWPTRAAAIGTLLFVLALSAGPSLSPEEPGEHGHVYDRLGGDLFEAAFARGSLPGCTQPDDRWLLWRCGERPVVTLFERVLKIVNALAGLAVGALIVGMILSLDERPTRDVEEEAALLADNLQHMRQHLYLAGLILTFGMLFATSWMYWPLQLVAEAERAEYARVLLSAALYTGTYFSLLILSFYLPVALVLDGRIRDLAESAGEPGARAATHEVAKWKEARGLSGSVGDYMRAGFAMTAPIMAAFAGGISPLSL